MTMIKALIIEDEINNQELLTNLLKQFCQNVQVCGVAASVSDGIAKINSLNPDIVFLDYQIQGGNGFDVLEAFDAPTFKVIFITGYSEFAIKAFKYAALDYILKPINIDELVAAVSRFKPQVKDYRKNYEFLISEMANDNQDLDRIVVPYKNEYQVVNFEKIIFIQAVTSFAKLYLTDGISLLSSQSLKFYEESLPKNSFFKIHKSYIINTLKVKSVSQGRGGKVYLTNGHEVPIAIRRKPDFLKYLKP